ncbi:MAG TPA: serine/threonine protein phosphatase [Flammeovirgaceae bacterium]|nr:serine/threonine protein phosphatase [Flammeovirgaceae bacterium]
MLSAKSIIRIALVLAILAWLAMVATDMVVIFDLRNPVNMGIEPQVPNIFFVIYVLAVFVFYKYRIGAAQSDNFIDLLWKIFITGLLTTIVSLALTGVDVVLGGTNLISHPLVVDVLYLIRLGLLLAFAISTFVVWKRLILYQKSKLLLRGWMAFEYLLLATLLSLFVPFDFTRYLFFVVLPFAVVLSGNMKWVAFLSFKQKWKSLLLLVLTLLYLIYFYINISEIRGTHPYLQVPGNMQFVLSLLVFTALYAVFSLLVILFNLPTSSVFEQKLEEVVNFQRLSQSVQTEQSESQIYNILLNSAVRATQADAAWIEVKINDKEKMFRHRIGTETIMNIKNYFKNSKGSNPFIFEHPERPVRHARSLRKLRGVPFASMVVFPLVMSGEQTGMIVLLKELREGFNRDLIDIAQTFVNQACISVEGFRLMAEALATERYKEELKIAQRVQRQLLPATLHDGPDFEIAAFSQAADEVGGDYYDTLQIDNHKTALIIGDVSGKGTSAAFHMSQMRGIFHGLAQMNLPPEEFLLRANRAISSGLDKTSFITISYYVIDSAARQVTFARAGHCPTLYYSHQTGKASYFANKGLGLGMVRNSQYQNYIQPRTFSYKPGDILILYTDGITEARNKLGEEFGYERLITLVEQHAELAAYDIQQRIIDALYEFCGHRELDDDYTVIIVKFK